MQSLRSRTAWTVTATVLLACMLVDVRAQETSDKTDESKQAAEKKNTAANSKKDTEPANPTAEWDTLVKRKLEITDRLQKLQGEFVKADDDGKKKIRDEFQGLIDEFKRQIYPKMVELAPAVFAKNPKAFEAGELVLKTMYGKNQYDKAVELADKLIAAERTTQAVLNIAGAAHFAVHNFEKAQSVVQQADKDGKLTQQLGARYLTTAGEYVEHWKIEQEIRAREAAAEGDDALPRVEFDTSRGKVVLELFENEAPNTVANFVSLVESKKYDGTKFHRVIPSFMAQGGDPNSKDDDPTNDGQGGPGYTIECECYRKDARMHFRGSISMAHAGKDSGGSQFFLTHLPTAHLNPNSERMSGHTVFGRIVEGIDIAAAIQIGDSIKTAKVLRKRNHEYKLKTKPEVKK